MVGLLIISDTRFYREGLARVLADNRRLRVVGVFGSVDEASRSLDQQCPDVILVDLVRNATDKSVRVIQERFSTAKVIALGVPEIESEIIACAEAGVVGYILREDSVEDLVAAVDDAMQGRLTCSRHIAAALFRRIATLSARGTGNLGEVQLTFREWEIIGLVNNGLANKEIASRLVISVATVKNHVHNIIEKLGVRSRGEAAALARRLYPAKFVREPHATPAVAQHTPADSV